jgi:hypothetical protein
VLPDQVPDDDLRDQVVEGTWRELFDGPVLRLDRSPRWVLLLAGASVFLVDRDKWPQGKYLEFHLGELLGRREPKALRALAALLHRKTLVPEDGSPLFERLDEESHRHAYAVSTDLKHGVRQAIELLGNEAVRYLREVAKDKVFDRGALPDSEFAQQLTRDSITWLYRLLFLFYVESRGDELGVVPMKSEAYREGYSLEKLRDLELVALTSVAAREGFYLHESLDKLFGLVQRGAGRPIPTAQTTFEVVDEFLRSEFEIPPLRSSLFDPDRTPILKRVRLRNQVMQKILRLLSLSRESRRQRGRISYAQLGINQLGAVYEGLLSYRGFFAQEELVELRDPGAGQKEEAQTWFVPAKRAKEYPPEALAKDEQGLVIRHPKGAYLFRLAGRDREKSASYYTPEVLTCCVVKYTLKERLGEKGTRDALPADEILKLTLCEPAMGSGAFLNETISQLAEAYLDRKQTELGQRIPAENYQHELRKVKWYLAVHCAYGVDLNPLAAELGKISLWLGVLHERAEAPFLDPRIAVGNSLVGARREVFTAKALSARPKKGEEWWNNAPERVKPGEARPKGTVYHFLVPDPGMAPFDGEKVAAGLLRDEARALKAWRRGLSEPWSPIDVVRLDKLSVQVDELWDVATTQRGEFLARLAQPIQLWGQPTATAGDRIKSLEECAEIAAIHDRQSHAEQTLADVMDYWCALWFWPMSQAGGLPTRQEWLGDLEMMLGRNGAAGRRRQERLELVRTVAIHRRFHHWELRFNEVFEERGGFDIIVGNPPWIKVSWEEAGVLGDLEPNLVIGRLDAKEVASRRTKLLARADAQGLYLAELEEALGTQGFFNAAQNYPLLIGVQTNLYKCFITRAWTLLDTRGFLGLIHQPGLFDDPGGGRLRSELNRRLSWVARFKNELRLFYEVEAQRSYCVSVSSGSKAANAGIRSLSDIYHPRTLDDSIAHSGAGSVPLIKTDDGKWDLRGHRSLVVPIDDAALGVFARLYDEPGTPALEARLPVVRSVEILEVLRRFADTPRRLGDLGGECFFTVCFDETGAKHDGTIRHETRNPKRVGEWIVSGPHFYVGNPLYKTPREGAKLNTDYDPVDLTVITDDYLPRTNYIPACNPKDYLARTPTWRGRSVTEFYRHVHRKMLAPTGERTLISAVVPPGPAHLLTVVSTIMVSRIGVVRLAALTASLPYDFYVKTTGRSAASRTRQSRFVVLFACPPPQLPHHPLR